MTLQSTQLSGIESRNASPPQSLLSWFRRYPQFTISPAILVALLALWWLASDVLHAPTYVVPPPEKVFQALVRGLSRAPWDHAICVAGIFIP